MALMRMGLSEMQPKMAEGAALFRPTILFWKEIWMPNNAEPSSMGNASLTHPTLADNDEAAALAGIAAAGLEADPG